MRDFARRARVLGVPVLKVLPQGFPGGGVDTRPVCLVVGKFIVTMTMETNQYGVYILRILLVLQQTFGEGVYEGY